jgi:alkylation response protein AidB-like acyl-CoA dehydrogenase
MTTDAMWRRATATAPCQTQRSVGRRNVWAAAGTGKPFDPAEGSMSKLVAGRPRSGVTEQAIQILGGNGYTREYPVER